MAKEAEYSYFHIFQGPVLAATMDGIGHLYYIEDNRCFIMTLVTRQFYVLDIPNKELRDLAADKLGNVYLVTNNTVELLEPNLFYSRTVFGGEGIDIKSVTVDILNNVYILANLGYGDEAYCLNGEVLYEIPKGHLIKSPFAVDSNSNKYFGQHVIERLINYTMAGFREATIYNVAVSKDNYIFYATDKGLFVSQADACLAYHIEEIKIPNITKVFSAQGDIFFISADEEVGGVYILYDRHIFSI